ncbi:hypothetical protein [Saccharopolyspora hattusasensis]|uniref:hypothetical protein n=1 Tax=Saccharopolyspora hattusasensis TaxID=1128679 RepID=UPI003D979C5A
MAAPTRRPSQTFRRNESCKRRPRPRIGRDKVDVLDSGADDYLTRPLGLDELLARIRAVSHRTTPNNAATVPLGNDIVDLATRTAAWKAGSGCPAEGSGPNWQALRPERVRAGLPSPVIATPPKRVGQHVTS